MVEQRINTLYRLLEHIEGLIAVYNTSPRFAGHSSKLQARVFDLQRQIERLEAEDRIGMSEDESH
jgi:hypothetical protein